MIPERIDSETALEDILAGPSAADIACVSRLSGDVLILGAGGKMGPSRRVFAASRFSSDIPGIHEVLRRQGLMAGRWCLNPQAELSPGQMNEIDRVLARYPHLSDNEFVKEGLDRWLS